MEKTQQKFVGPKTVLFIRLTVLLWCIVRVKEVWRFVEGNSSLVAPASDRFRLQKRIFVALCKCLKSGEVDVVNSLEQLVAKLISGTQGTDEIRASLCSFKSVGAKMGALEPLHQVMKKNLQACGRVAAHVATRFRDRVLTQDKNGSCEVTQ